MDRVKTSLFDISFDRNWIVKLSLLKGEAFFFFNQS